MNNSVTKQNQEARMVSFFIISAFILMLFAPEMSFAAPADDPIAKALCRIFDLMQGSVAKTVGIIGIAALGIGLFLGKLNWGVAVAVGIGVVLIFGAPAVVKWISGGVDASNCLG